jgi:hypothetical protein
MLGPNAHRGMLMQRHVCVPLFLSALIALPVQAGVTGQCKLEGKPIKFVDGYAAMAPDPFEKSKQVATFWFLSVPLEAGALAGKKPADFDDVISSHAFDKDSTTLELRLDEGKKLVEQLQMYVPPGTSRSMSSNAVGKLALKAPFGAKAAGSWALTDDDDLSCNISFDLAIGASGAAGVAPKPWGTALPAGGGAPGAVYMAMHKATLAGDVDGMLKHATKARAAEMDKARKDPDFKMMLEMIKAMEPKEVRIVSGRADAAKAELQIAGKEGDGASMTGTVKLVMEGGAWKIEKVETKSSLGGK